MIGEGIIEHCPKCTVPTVATATAPIRESGSGCLCQGHYFREQTEWQIYRAPTTEEISHHDQALRLTLLEKIAAEIRANLEARQAQAGPQQLRDSHTEANLNHG